MQLTHHGYVHGVEVHGSNGVSSVVRDDGIEAGILCSRKFSNQTTAARFIRRTRWSREYGVGPEITRAF